MNNLQNLFLIIAFIPLIIFAKMDCKTDIYFHEIKKGESLELIAKQHNIKVTEIMKHNSMRSTKLVLGEVIEIPKKNEHCINEKNSNKKDNLNNVKTANVFSFESIIPILIGFIAGALPASFFYFYLLKKLIFKKLRLKSVDFIVSTLVISFFIGFIRLLAIFIIGGKGLVFPLSSSATLIFFACLPILFSFLYLYILNNQSKI